MADEDSWWFANDETHEIDQETKWWDFTEEENQSSSLEQNPKSSAGDVPECKNDLNLDFNPLPIYEHVEPVDKAVAPAKPSSRIIRELQQEKLRVLQKLINERKVNFECDVDIKSPNLCILEGGEKCVQKCLEEVYQILASFENGTVDFSSGIVALLSSPAGEEWLEEQLSKYRLCAVVYANNSQIYAISDTTESLAEVRKLLLTGLITGEVLFGRDDEKYLRSRKGMDELSRFKSRPMMLVSVNYDQRKVIVDGCCEQVNKTITEVNELLKMNSHRTKQMTLNKDVYQVLELMKDEVSNCVGDNINIDNALRFVSLRELNCPTACGQNFLV